MPEIVLSTLNAKYIHASFGLRCLLANMGPLRETTVMLEFDIRQRPLEIVERLLKQEARILGLGVYIWNLRETLEVVTLLKSIRPELVVILGGPEVSHETEGQPIVEAADYVITGEADLKFREVCESLISGVPPSTKIIPAGLPDLSNLKSPYPEYTEEDIAHRLIYVEASRGCPYSCEFCLSSLDIPVRQFQLDPLLSEFEKLIGRGVKHFKFVDRTFNLNIQSSATILQFFLDRYQPGMFFHFEMVPDRLPEALRELIRKFPTGSLQFEVGIQSFNSEVGTLISRRQNFQKLEDNFRFLHQETGVHIHADLIVGLPGEDIQSFGMGFDRLIRLKPQEIQVGILKKLKGTPIARHDLAWGMVYDSHPPYEILKTRLISFEEMQRMRRFARYWDLVGNSGNFQETTPLIWENHPSPFEAFLHWSHWLHEAVGRTDSISLLRLMESLQTYLVEVKKIAPARVRESLWADYQRTGHRDRPRFLREEPDVSRIKPPNRGTIPDSAGLLVKRQRRRVSSRL
jgi:radical SAM superfamily enzyme YgiQ (UPF0313 family)